MDELGFNKIAAAILVTALGFMGLKEISHSAMHVTAPDTPAYALEIEEVPVAGGEVIVLPFPTTTWVGAMDETRGAKVFKKCMSCHNADKGGANGTGPNLYGVVGQAAGVHAGFSYSSAMTQSGLTWDYETLDGYLKKPTKYLSGTAMNFVGLKKEGDRAAVIAYLRAQSDTPMAMPVPAVSTEASAEGVTDIAIDNVQEGAAVVVDAAQNGAEDGAAAAAEGAKSAADVVSDGAKDVVNAAGDVADKTLDVAGDAADKALDAAGGLLDKVKSKAEGVTEEGVKAETPKKDDGN